MSERLILRCEDSISGILSALYDGFVYKNRMEEPYRDNITISLGEGDTLDLFAREIVLKKSEDKAEKTAYAISHRLGYGVYNTVFHALCHYEEDRASAVLGYLVRAFSKGTRIRECLADPYVLRVMELSRKVYNEYDKFCGFLRFRDIGQCLVAEFEPKCDMLPLFVEHFSDRYPNENFLIYDRKRQYALVHPAFQSCFFLSDEERIEGLLGDLKLSAKDEFEQLWKRYFHSAAIGERKNERYQNRSVPKWYRSDMLEFS